MAAAKHDYIREEFSAATADPSFRNPVLPGTAVRDATWLDTHRPDDVHYNRFEDGIAVENEILWRDIVRKRFPQLLDSPRRCRVESGIEVQNTSSAVLYHEEYVKHFNRDCRNGKEIHRPNGVFVVA